MDSTHISFEHQLAEAQNKVKELEEKIFRLENEVRDKNDTIFNVEFNLEQHTAWVDNWTDADGYEFTGRIYWTKRAGSLKQGYASYFEGEWNVEGNIVEGELTEYGEVVEKWEDGELIEEEEESETEVEEEESETEVEDEEEEESEAEVEDEEEEEQAESEKEV